MDRIGRYERSGGGSSPSGITKYGGYRQGDKLGLNPRGTGNCTGFDYSILFKNNGEISRKILGTGSALEMRRSFKGCGGSNPLFSARSFVQ